MNALNPSSFGPRSGAGDVIVFARELRELAEAQRQETNAEACLALWRQADRLFCATNGLEHRPMKMGLGELLRGEDRVRFFNQHPQGDRAWELLQPHMGIPKLFDHVWTVYRDGRALAQLSMPYCAPWLPGRWPEPGDGVTAEKIELTYPGVRARWVREFPAWRAPDISGLFLVTARQTRLLIET